MNDERVKTSYFEPDKTMPLVIEPAAPGLDLATWAAESRDALDDELRRHGAVLFRGFDVATSTDFERVAASVCPSLFGEYGDLPREGVSGKVYGSTPYPSDQAILFHNESSHMHRWPMRIFFNCRTAAKEGGETPIVDCREIYNRLDPEIRDRLATKRLMYVRNYTKGLDVSWQDFFRTEDRAEVEAYCDKAGIEYEWKKGDGLRTRQLCQAVAKHPHTGEMSFFNQIQLHHVSCIDPEVRKSLLMLFKEQDIPRNVYYGDGTPIEDEVVDAIRDLYWKTSVAFTWQEGDMIVLDNMMTAHARNPYVGPRKIVVAMGQMFERKDLDEGENQRAAANTHVG